jgi:hypothetical protein
VATMTPFKGERNRQGDWVPAVPVKLAQIFVWPFKPLAFLKYLTGLPGYFLPWGVFYMSFPILTWWFFTPPMDDFKTVSLGTATYVYGRNLVMVMLVCGAFHLHHYGLRRQGTDYKYTDKWLAQDNPRFLFKSQFLDNLFWTVASAVPVWTAFELITMWLYANNHLPRVEWREHPIYCAILFALIPMFRDFHF